MEKWIVQGNRPYHSDELRKDVAGLTERHADLETGAAGKSVLGTPIPWLRWGIGPARALYNAAHHANEWITAPLLMRFIERLCQAAERDGEFGGESARALHGRVTLYAVPMVNPDGADLVTGRVGPGSEAYDQAWAMRGDLPFPEAWKANIRGVDLNNNYPARFLRGRAVKDAKGGHHPGPRDYTGLYPLSEPETAAMAALTAETGPALTVALHSQGREIYYRFDGVTPPGGRRIGRRMADASGYVLADPPGASYGGYKDWCIVTWNRPAYTVEAGYGENPLPVEDFEAIYEELEPILLIGLYEASQDFSNGE
jgi:g-D-glutamyl-meso-diaminopimelate peptidase